jgi:hypothetical protein
LVLLLVLMLVLVTAGGQVLAEGGVPSSEAQFEVEAGVD